MAEQKSSPGGKQKPIRVYTCGTSWRYDMAHDSYGTKVYPSLAAVKKTLSPGHQKECGIVELEVRLVRWVKKGTL